VLIRFRLLDGRSLCLGQRPHRVLVLSCVLAIVPLVSPPAPNRISSSGQFVRPSPLAASGDEGLPDAILLKQPPLLDAESAEAWKHLPAAERGMEQPLPAWARKLARTLPHTTAAMLELDYLHRVRNPLEPRLRGQLRWVAARTNGCRYSEEYAAADLLRAGLNEAEIRQLAGDWETLPSDKRIALRFARKLTCDGSSVTDAEVMQLVSRYGERQVVAMVLLLAHANFQDRLILALGLPPESGGPKPALDVRFPKRPLGANRAAPRPEPRQSAVPAAADLDLGPIAPDLYGVSIQELLAGQRARRCRIALPPTDPDVPRWGLVCQTYQPEFAAAWSACTQAFGAEANQDPIFEDSVFWIITHRIGCFY
jgi:alkylhydroperoxidase family enzyme